MIVEDLTLSEFLGEGITGTVYLTTKKGDLNLYATKQIDRSKILKDLRLKKYLNNEIFMLKKINHPNLIKYYDYKFDDKYIYILTEYCNGGTLSHYLKNPNITTSLNQFRFPEKTVQYLMKQIISGIQYLHKNNIIHRDINLDNILISYRSMEDMKERNINKGTIKIIDFHFSRYFSQNELNYSVLGVPLYMDPIILRKLNKKENCQKLGYNEKADIWSLGIICYEMIVGKTPFDADSLEELLNKIEIGDYYLPNYLSKEAIFFINSMLQYDPKIRLNAEQLYNHPFLKKSFSECRINKININEIGFK